MNAFPIRPGMDVFTAFQNQYLGLVTQVWHQGRNDPDAGPASARRAHQAEVHTPEQPLEQGRGVSATETLFNHQSGEEMGPFPTEAAGNTGPIVQSAQQHYATGGHFPSVSYFAVRPGRLNLGPFTPLIYVPVSAIRSISLERIILDVPQGKVPDRWNFPPA